MTEFGFFVCINLKYKMKNKPELQGTSRIKALKEGETDSEPELAPHLIITDRIQEAHKQ
jgi:hypothetical protein